MSRPDWAPDMIDIERPSVARMYDYFLGGSHNFAVDRAAANQVISAVPDTPLIAQANRAFLRRVVRFLADSGIRQFLDIGSGIPTVGNVHEIAAQIAPDARVVYVDVDPVAVAHSREILAGNDNAAVVQEDLRQPEAILSHPDVVRLIDFSRPVAVLIVSVMHFIPDEEKPGSILATLRRAMAPGSYLALSQGSRENRTDEDFEAGREAYKPATTIVSRTHAEIAELFDGYEIVDPGVVYVPLWRPDSAPGMEDPLRSVIIGGVGRLDG
jgi:hypothetical protein